MKEIGSTAVINIGMAKDIVTTLPKVNQCTNQTGSVQNKMDDMEDFIPGQHQDCSQCLKGREEQSRVGLRR